MIDSYGPWMLATKNTRKPTMQQGEKEKFSNSQGSKKGGNTKTDTENTKGSRFTLLDEEIIEINEKITEVCVETTNGKDNLNIQNYGPKFSEKYKGKRPTVIVNEKHVMGESEIGGRNAT